MCSSALRAANLHASVRWACGCAQGEFPLSAGATRALAVPGSQHPSHSLPILLLPQPGPMETPRSSYHFRQIIITAWVNRLYKSWQHLIQSINSPLTVSQFYRKTHRCLQYLQQDQLEGDCIRFPGEVSSQNPSYKRGAKLLLFSHIPEQATGKSVCSALHTLMWFSALKRFWETLAKGTNHPVTLKTAVNTRWINPA